MLTIVCCISCILKLALFFYLALNSNRNILIKLGERVRKIRSATGLSQEKLAEKANLHRTYIGMIERAEKNITLINIEKIANALEISIKDLFDGL